MQKNKSNLAFDHMSLTVGDFQESREWYWRVFGFELVEEGKSAKGSPWGILRSGDSMLCLHEEKSRRALKRDDPSDESVHRIFHFGIRVHDRADWEARVSREKIHVEYGGAYRYPHSTSWYVKDPTGHQ